MMPSRFFLTKQLPMAINRSPLQFLFDPLVTELTSHGDIFDFQNDFKQNAIWVFVTAAKGGIFKTDTAINLSTLIARMKYQNGSQVKTGLMDTNSGQYGIKAKLKELIHHPYGLWEFLATTNTDYQFNIFEKGFYNMGVSSKDPNMVLKLFPLYGQNFPKGDYLSALKAFCDGGLDRRPKSDIEKKIVMAKNNFQRQLTDEIDKKLDVLVFDTSNHVEPKNTRLMRQNPDNCVVLITDPVDTESVNGSMSYIQTLFSREHNSKTQFYPKILLAFNSDPEESPLLKNTDYLKTIVTYFDDVDFEVLKERLYVEQIAKDDAIKIHNAAHGTPWVNSGKFSEDQVKPLARLASYIVNGHYPREPETKDNYFNKFMRLLGLQS